MGVGAVRSLCLAGLTLVGGVCQVGSVAQASEDTGPAVVEQEVSEQDLSEQVVGGGEIAISSAPWQVALLGSSTSSGYLAQFCGGAIISARWVVTASHCVRDDLDVPLTPGELQIGSGSASLFDYGSASRVGVAQIIEHPSYESGSFLNDIALLRLSSDLDLSGTNRAAIQLPFSVDADAWPARDTAVTATGWGCTDVLGFEDSCSNYPDALRSVGLSVQASPGDWQCAEVIGYWSPLMMCAGTAGGGADTCSGDSGGPLVVGEGSSALLAGITSWGEGCGLAGYPGVYTRVTAYVDWVSAQTGITATPATPVVETPAVDGFNALGPTRLFDTRSGSLVGNGGEGGAPLVFRVGGVAGVPVSGVSAVALNVTVTGGSAGGYVTVYPCSSGRPVASNVNFSAGATVANAVVAPFGAGELCFYVSGATHLIADVSGYLTPV